VRLLVEPSHDTNTQHQQGQEEQEIPGTAKTINTLVQIPVGFNKKACRLIKSASFMPGSPGGVVNLLQQVDLQLTTEEKKIKLT
jgi:hypothetical protein